jgi:hypothetical protein
MQFGANKRKHERVRVQFRSHFAVKGNKVRGDGELTDLSPSGCRVKSAIPVQVGMELELCIFVSNEANPITIDAALVRWAKGSEFGVSFTAVRLPIQRRLTEVWRKLASPF